MGKVNKFNQWLDRHIFSWGSATTLGLYRILVGVLALANWCLINPFFEDWFTERGFVPVELTKRWQGDAPRFDPLTHLGNDALTQVVWIAIAVFAVMTIIGFKTRFATIALFLCIVAINHRNPLILHSGDTMLRMNLFLLAIAPAGAALSLDRKLAKTPAPQINQWPLRLIQIQVAVMYGTTVIHKAFGNMWWDGTAAWYPTRLSEFDRFPVPAFMDSIPLIKIATYGTILVEIALATLVFDKRFRKWVLIGGLILHGFIEYRMNIPLFAFISTAQYIAFYKGEEVEGFLRKVKLLPSQPTAPLQPSQSQA